MPWISDERAIVVERMSHLVEAADAIAEYVARGRRAAGARTTRTRPCAMRLCSGDSTTVTNHSIGVISSWFESNCDGDWEQATRFQISNLDNPGWSLEASLEGTPLALRSFEEVERTKSEHDWVRCWVEGATFHGVGGPGNLTELIEEFAAWIAPEGDAPI